MIEQFREIENSYIENFSTRRDGVDYITYSDDKLPGMYDHNCIVIKPSVNKDTLCDMVSVMLEQAKKENREFLKVVISPGIDITEEQKKIFTNMGFEVEANLYMQIEGTRNEAFKANPNVEIRVANTEEEFDEAKKHEITSSIEAGTPKDFVKKKATRRLETFKTKRSNLKLYLCYYQNNVIGHCELHTKGNYAKIDDFYVMSDQRGMGFGTSILKQAISDSVLQGASYIYLITDKEDTPRQMYSKLGFEIIGEEYELYWKR